MSDISQEMKNFLARIELEAYEYAESIVSDENISNEDYSNALDVVAEDFSRGAIESLKLLYKIYEFYDDSYFKLDLKNVVDKIKFNEIYSI